MHTHRRLIVNTALMTGSSIVMRCIALVFQAWLVGHIGAAGIGLYQLVLSVSVLLQPLPSPASALPPRA